MSTKRHLRRMMIALAVTAFAVSGCGGGSGGSSDNAAPNGGKFAPPATPEGIAPGTGQPDGQYGSTVSGEIPTDQQPLSTFAVDVDTASYGYAKRLLLDGRRPVGGSVRPEEFVNAFRQDYRQPPGNGFDISTDGTRLPQTHRGERPETARLLRIGLQTRGELARERSDAALTFVVDVSGSMAEPGKLDLVQDALRVLIEQLRPTDSVAVVAYSDKAEVVRPMTSARDRAGLRAAVDRLRVSGSTNLEAGLLLGYETARKGFRQGITNRVILLSDGLPNVGNTNAEPILRVVREAAAKQISLLGVGVGSDYGDAFMEQLADRGDGFVVYVSDVAQARRVFVERLPATLAVRALDAKAQVQFDPSVVASYRLIGYENRALSASAFRNDRVDGGEVGPGHSVTALYALHLHPSADTRAGEGRLGEVRVRWLDPTNRAPTEEVRPISLGALDRSFESAAPRLRMCYTAAYFAEVLRSSQVAAEVRLADLAEVARQVGAATGDGEVDELADLITRAGRFYG